jgi:hypothetical protein
MGLTIHHWCRCSIGSASSCAISIECVVADVVTTRPPD